MNLSLSSIDKLLFFFLLVCLLVISFSARGNIQADPVDYYTILQRIVSPHAEPLVQIVPFVDQRSPGYSLLALPVYYGLEFFVRPLTNFIKLPMPPTPPIPQTQISQRHSERGLEFQPLPPQPLMAKDLFFHNFPLPETGRILNGTLLTSLITTSFICLFLGIYISVKTIHLIFGPKALLSVIPLTIIASPLFLANIVITPAYATLSAFAFCSLFTFFLAIGLKLQQPKHQFLTGLFAGALVLTRLEAIVLVVVVAIYLFFIRQTAFLRRLILGGLIPACILLVYSTTQLHTLLPTAIMKGNINTVTLNLSYVFDAILRPTSGILFWSPLLVLGIIGLFLNKQDQLFIILGYASLYLILLYIVRVPIMYLCVGQSSRIIGQLPITCPTSIMDARLLVRSDMNRYLTILAPFSFIGLQYLYIVLKEKLIHD